MRGVPLIAADASSLPFASRFRAPLVGRGRAASVAALKNFFPVPPQYKTTGYNRRSCHDLRGRLFLGRKAQCSNHRGRVGTALTGRAGIRDAGTSQGPKINHGPEEPFSQNGPQGAERESLEPQVQEEGTKP